MRHPRRPLLPLLAAILLASLYLLYHVRSSLYILSTLPDPLELKPTPPSTPSLPTASNDVTNATLGFGLIAAISRAGSNRSKALKWAANLTGIEISIPQQPLWTEDDVAAFKLQSGSQISRGSAMAWLGHLHALKWFLSTPHQTALLVEDDVDWNIAIRTTQIRHAEAALRSILSASPSPGPDPSPKSAPWAFAQRWELLWLGHCGDDVSPEQMAPRPHRTYNDSTVPPHAYLDDSTSSFLSLHLVPEHRRVVYRSRWPLCTFAYAVTRASAQRILATYGSATASAYDVALLEACRDHDWACFTVAPELFHHVGEPSEIAIENGVAAEADSMPTTRNIGCGARRQNLWVEEEDWVGRAWMLEQVWNGRCYREGVQTWTDRGAARTGDERQDLG